MLLRIPLEKRGRTRPHEIGQSTIACGVRPPHARRSTLPCAESPRAMPSARTTARFRVVVLDEKRRLDPQLRELLVRALPAMAERLASCGGSVDAAPDRGE